MFTERKELIGNIELIEHIFIKNKIKYSESDFVKVLLEKFSQKEILNMASKYRYN